MIAAALFLLSAASPPQAGDDARVLLEEVTAASRAAKSWHAEGTTDGTITGPGMQVHDETAFQVAWRSPSLMLWNTLTTKESAGGIDHGFRTSTLMVCDGRDHWTLAKPGSAFYRSSTSVSPCKPEMGDFSKLTDGIVSAAVVGHDRIPFGGATGECTLVRAEYASHAIRILCVDPVRKLVLRDRTERALPSGAFVNTVTFTSFERDTDLPASLFQFDVPTGTTEDPGPLSDRPVVSSFPTVASKVEPEYTPEALQAGISGLVLVSLHVTAEGRAENLKIVRGLGHGLDEKAIEAVRQWRFAPATASGAPVAFGPLNVAVRFRP
jgi:TonB family protein